jgi:hypothetical protein
MNWNFALRTALFSLLFILSSLQAQQTAHDVFYNKDKVQAFFGVKGDYRVQKVDDLNDTYFNTEWGYYSEINDTVYFFPDPMAQRYGRFEELVSNVHLEVGGQYEQFLTWFNFSVMPTARSERPAIRNSFGQKMYDLKYYTFGVEWMFAWMLLPEKYPVNIIPSIGAGFSALNLQYATNYNFYFPVESPDYIYDPYTLRSKYYTAFGKSLTTELELRFNMGETGISVGGYAGYRVMRFDEIVFEEDGSDLFISGNPDNNMDSWYAGLKATYTLTSAYDKKLKDE